MGSFGHWPRRSPAPSGKGETPSQPGKGKTSRFMAEGKPRVICGEESSEPTRRREDLSCLAWGKPRPSGEKKALSHPAKEILGAARLGGNPGLLAPRKA